MLALALALLASAAPVAEKAVQTSDWQPLFARGAIDEARTKCEGWLTSRVAQTRAEAHKCLANVELARAGDIEHYPSDHRVAGNLAALHLEIGDPRGALPWAKKAAVLAPQDVIDRANLARIQHKLGDLDAAKREYDLAMSLPADEDRRMLVRCWYADLLVDARDEKRACRLQREAGERCAPTACAKK